MKKILPLLILLFLINNISFAQERNIARGAEPGELYLTGQWYGVYNPIWPAYYDTLQTAVYRITENGKKLTLQYNANYFGNPTNEMIPDYILADATTGVLYSVSHYSKNSYPYTALWISFDYGKNWIFREENIGSKKYYPANFNGLIYQGGGAGYISNDYANSWDLLHNQNHIYISESLHDKYKHIGISGSPPYYPYTLFFTDNFYLTYTELLIDPEYVFGQIWGRFPDVYRGGLPGEVYVSSMFPEENYKATYKVSFSADTGHTFRHVYVSEQFDTQGPFPVFMSDREPGVFYIVKSYQVEDFNPWGHHTKVCIEYYRDYGEILEAVFCHDITKNYEYEEIICDNTTLLESSVHQKNIQLQWINSADNIRGYHVFRNNTRITNQMLTEPVYLDENLPNGNYEYYVRTYYEEGCVSDSSNHVRENITVGVKEINDLEGVKVYPNPTFSTVTIETNNFSKVEIYNIFGQLLQTAKTRVVDVSTFNAGVYFFKIFDIEGNSVVKKVVVVR